MAMGDQQSDVSDDEDCTDNSHDIHNPHRCDGTVDFFDEHGTTSTYYGASLWRDFASDHTVATRTEAAHPQRGIAFLEFDNDVPTMGMAGRLPNADLGYSNTESQNTSDPPANRGASIHNDAGQSRNIGSDYGRNSHGQAPRNQAFSINGRERPRHSTPDLQSRQRPTTSNTDLQPRPRTRDSQCEPLSRRDGAPGATALAQRILETRDMEVQRLPLGTKDATQRFQFQPPWSPHQVPVPGSRPAGDSDRHPSWERTAEGKPYTQAELDLMREWIARPPSGPGTLREKAKEVANELTRLGSTRKFGGVYLKMHLMSKMPQERTPASGLNRTRIPYTQAELDLMREWVARPPSGPGALKEKAKEVANKITRLSSTPRTEVGVYKRMVRIEREGNEGRNNHVFTQAELDLMREVERIARPYKTLIEPAQEVATHLIRQGSTLKVSQVYAKLGRMRWDGDFTRKAADVDGDISIEGSQAPTAEELEHSSALDEPESDGQDAPEGEGASFVETP